MVYGVYDSARPLRPGRHVTRRDPATDAFGLEFSARGVGYRFVLMGVAYEGIKIHWPINRQTPINALNVSASWLERYKKIANRTAVGYFTMDQEGTSTGVPMAR
jgi:hypothetical protein